MTTHRIRDHCPMCAQTAELTPEDYVIIEDEIDGTTRMFTCPHCGAYVQKDTPYDLQQRMMRIGVLTADELAERIIEELESNGEGLSGV